MNQVQPVLGESLRFRVQSRSRPNKWFLVELDALQLNGCCDCENFRYRLAPLLGDVHSVKRRCAHIMEAREYFLDRMLEQIARAEKQNAILRNETNRASAQLT